MARGGAALLRQVQPIDYDVLANGDPSVVRDGSYDTAAVK